VPRRSILYISYDGMLEPLGQSQVLAYLERLAADYSIRLISFEKKSDWRSAEKRGVVEARMAAAGIAWIPLRYHKRPTAPATAYDIAVGTLVAWWQAVRHRVCVVHARSYVAAMMALAVRRLTGARFLFDMRGFWADERVDAGIWPADGGLYRFAKRMERRYLLAADTVVTLTHASERAIRAFPYMKDRATPIVVIPTCADLDRFSRHGAGEGAPFTFGFVGAATTWSLIDEVFAVFRIIQEREPDARLLIVNRNEHDHIRERLAACGIDAARVELVAAEHRDVPALVSRMNVAAAVRKPAFSQLACAPTKIGEYLGCGVPCLVNAGIGDVDAVEAERVGVMLEAFTDDARRAAAGGLIALSREPGIRERCVAAARKLFSLDEGVTRYAGIYRQLCPSGSAS
jgi:glycosyltransferase involved in cell wall biosynthesis